LWRSIRSWTATVRWDEQQLAGIALVSVDAEGGDAEVLPAEHGHEEVYIVIRGRARFDVADNSIEATPGQLLYARAGVLRSALALADDTLVLAIGGLPGSYTPPIWSTDWRPPE